MPTISHTSRATRDFVIVERDLLRDPKLSLRARGLLCTLLSHDDGWSTSIRSLADASPHSRSIVADTVRELEEGGYLHIEGTGRKQVWHVGVPIEGASMARATRTRDELEEEQGTNVPTKNAKADPVKAKAHEVCQWAWDQHKSKHGHAPAWSFPGIRKMVEDLLRNESATARELAQALSVMNAVTRPLLAIQLDKLRGVNGIGQTHPRTAQEALAEAYDA